LLKNLVIYNVQTLIYVLVDVFNLWNYKWPKKYYMYLNIYRSTSMYI